MNYSFISFIFYIILCGFNGALMASIGYDYTHWQLWCSLFLIIGAFFCGRIHERHKHTNNNKNTEKEE